MTSALSPSTVSDRRVIAEMERQLAPRHRQVADVVLWVGLVAVAVLAVIAVDPAGALSALPQMVRAPAP